MTHLFVPYSIAAIAKERGFDEPCFGWYFADSDVNPLHIDYVAKQGFPTISAPLYSQLTNWFRKNHEIDIRIKPYYGPDNHFHGWTYEVDRFKKDEWYKFPMGFFVDHQTATEQAIEQAFKLI